MPTLAESGDLNLYAYCSNNPVMYTDPTGELAISAIIIGAIIGAIIGFGGTVLTDYLDDGQVFNGSVAWYDYLGATVLGGVIGAGIGYALPYISSFASTTFALGGGLAVSGGGAAAVAAGFTITGAQVLGAAGALGVTYLFAQTRKSGGYYGERWPGDPHKPDHIHLRGNGIDVRIGRDGKPIPGEPELGAQARKALRKLWDEFIKLFDRW